MADERTAARPDEPTHAEFTKALFVVTEDDSENEPPDFTCDDGMDE